MTSRSTRRPPTSRPSARRAPQYPGAHSLYGAYGALADAAGENINGHDVSTEPTGPNDPEVTDASGNQLQPGPGASGFIDRPTGTARLEPQLTAAPRARRASRRWWPRARASSPTRRSTPQDTGRLVSGTDGARQRDPTRHLRRCGQRHRALLPAGQRERDRRVQQLRQAMDRHIPAPERQRAARDLAERVQRERHPQRRGGDVHVGDRGLHERRASSRRTPPARRLTRCSTPPTSPPAEAIPAPC